MSTRVKSNPRANTLIIVAGIAVVAVVVAVAVIVFGISQLSARPNIDYSAIPQERLADGAFVLGSPDAPITIVAFKDFLCPHCQTYKPTLTRMIEAYVATGMARLEYRFFPAVDPTYSVISAQLAECADTLRPGSFWEAVDELFILASSERFGAATARKFAERMGMSYTELLTCTDTANQVQVDTQFGGQLGVSATPTILVRYGNSQPTRISLGGQPLQGSPNYDTLALLIETANGLR